MLQLEKLKSKEMKYQIKNEYIEASIDDLGAELCSLKKIDDDCEYIWQGDPKYWNRHSPILFPIVGKLKDNSYIYDNKSYEMSQHGFARDMHFKVFEQTENFICFKLESNESTMKVYPFEFELFLSYELKNSTLIISFEVKNISDTQMYFSIGAHPAFNWPLENESKDECYFEFTEIDELNTYCIEPTGISKDTKVIKLNDNKLFLDEELFKNDALIMKNIKHKRVSLKNKKNERFVTVKFKDFSYLGLWSKSSGADFVCIEPWHGVADFVDHDKNIENKKGIKKLKKSEVFSSAYSIKI